MRLWTGREINRLLSMTAQGASVEDVAAELGRSPGVVRVKAKRLREAGAFGDGPVLVPPPRRIDHAALAAQVAQMVAAGFSVREMAGDLGVDAKTVKRAVKALGSFTRLRMSTVRAVPADLSPGDMQRLMEGLRAGKTLADLRGAFGNAPSAALMLAVMAHIRDAGARRATQEDVARFDRLRASGLDRLGAAATIMVVPTAIDQARRRGFDLPRDPVFHDRRGAAGEGGAGDQQPERAATRAPAPPTMAVLRVVAAHLCAMPRTVFWDGARDLALARAVESRGEAAGLSVAAGRLGLARADVAARWVALCPMRAVPGAAAALVRLLGQMVERRAA